MLMAAGSLVSQREDCIGYPGHGRDDHNKRAPALMLDDLERVANGGEVGQRRAAELMHLGCTALAWWHRGRVKRLRSRVKGQPCDSP